MSILQTVFRVRVVYKSGYVHDFECTKFRIKNGTWEWQSASSERRPIQLGVDEIAAVWQVGCRYRLKLSFGATND